MKTQTIPELLVTTRGNMTELGRQLQCRRETIREYVRDFKAERHCIVNGVLMTKTKQKGRRP
ncbi:protein ninH [Serratia inhibens]|uniref:protein ninH n=1 Tax=Serratia inhibens TaxID=2338073 RepID=UPI003217FBCB